MIGRYMTFDMSIGLWVWCKDTAYLVKHLLRNNIKTDPGKENKIRGP
jgi:hypothetical protein